MRSTSLHSKALNYFLGTVILTEDKIAIISPWISDIEVKFPINNKIDSDKLNLIDSMKEFEKEFIIFTNRDEHNNYVESRLPEDVRVHKDEKVHMKMIVTETVVYLGSANITKTGTSNSKEICQIQMNPYHNVEEYLHKETEL